MMDQNNTSASFHENQNLDDIIKEHLPLLKIIFESLNPSHAKSWIERFAGAGITDASFPTPMPALSETFQDFGLAISPVELEHFDRLQHKYFGKLVENGEHVVYYDDRPTPYTVVKTLGFPKTGTSGQVEKVVSPASPKTVYARKEFRQVTDRTAELIEDEIILLRRFRHPHIIPFHGSYEHQGSLFLIFDFADGNLSDFLRAPPIEFTKLEDSAKACRLVNWMIDIADALTELHAIGGIHGNLKPENILIKNGTIMLSDSFYGKQNYMDLEQGRGIAYGWSLDVFAMGCIFLEMITFAMNVSLEYFGHF